jgi:DNA excision repair protein ERCC-2
VFNEGIREPFLAKISKELGKCIIIVDEAHNLPERVKDLASVRISTYIVRRAKQEATKYQVDVEDALDVLERLLVAGGQERFLEQDALEVSAEVIDEMQRAGDKIREEQRASFIGSVADFLKSWNVEKEAFARIYTPEFGGRDASIAYRCLDPGVIVAPVLEQAAASLVMSGTLSPTQMYTEVMDLPVGTKELTLPSPFPDENRLVLVVPRTTTKYTGRSPAMYEQIGTMVAEMANRIPGNSIAFFPSYDILRSVKETLEKKTTKAVFEETAGLSKDEREALLERFKAKKEAGAVLLAVTAGSFGEGVDLPGDLLKGVIIVGIPLSRPTKEVEALIAYYDRKYGRGWDYGYLVPAFNKVLQGAGRAIRTMTDRGAIIFLDERFSNPQYQRLFPPEWTVKTTLIWHKPLEAFFAGAPAEKKSLAPEYITEEEAIARANAEREKEKSKKVDDPFSSGDEF